MQVHSARTKQIQVYPDPEYIHPITIIHWFKKVIHVYTYTPPAFVEPALSARNLAKYSADIIS